MLGKDSHSARELGYPVVQCTDKQCRPRSVKRECSLVLICRRHTLRHNRRHGLGHRYGICEHLSPNHNLSQALTAGLPAKLSWVQLRRQAGGCRRLKYFMWTLSADAMYSSKTIPSSIFTGKMVENCLIRFAFRANLSTSAIHRRCAGDPLEQIAERCQL